MNVSLTPELEDYILSKVDTGLYGSASEVVREALRLLQERDHLYGSQLKALRRDVSLGSKQLRSGKGRPLDRKAIADLKAEGRRRVARGRRKGA